jgi:AmiR/NasT family two-component response regulator
LRLPYTDAKQNSVLIVSGSERSRETLAEVFASARYSPVTSRGSAAEARRLLLDAPYSLVFINTPLPDETGAQLALDLSSSRNCCVALIVPGDTYDQVNEQVEDAGVLTLSKPCTAQQLRQVAGMMSATRFKLADLEKKTATLEEKMEEVRLVNRAKWMLIERRGMDETAAHRYIEKLAMDARQTRRLVAQTLIRSLDND